MAIPSGSTAVVGPSGAGKSTLLRLLNRLADPDEGVVRFHDTDVRELDPLELRRRVGLGPIVGHEDERDAVQVPERVLHGPGGGGVERSRGLVEQQHLRLERQRPGEHHALLLPDRQPRGVPLREARVEPREHERPLGIDLLAVEARAEADVVGNRARNRGRQLRHEPHATAQLERIEVADVRVVKADDALVWVG